MPDTTFTTAMVQAKSIFASKTFWGNIVMGLGTLGANTALNLTPTENSAIVGAIAVINIFLRTTTTQPVSLTLPGTAAPMVGVPGTPVAAYAAPGAVLKSLAMLFALGAALSLTACDQNATPATTAAQVQRVQAGYAALKADMAVYAGSSLATPGFIKSIADGEAILDPEVASLSNAVSPTSIKGLVVDMTILDGSLPNGKLRTEIGLVEASIMALLAMQPVAPVTTVVPVG